MKKFIIITIILFTCINAFATPNYIDMGMSTTGRFNFGGSLSVYSAKDSIGVMNYITVPLKLNIGEDEFHEPVFGIGIGYEMEADNMYFGCDALFGDMIDLEMYGGYITGSHRLGGGFSFYFGNTEEDKTVEYGGWRGTYTENYNCGKFYAEYSYTTSSNIRLTARAGFETSFTRCADHWGGEEWVPNTTKLGWAKKDACDRVYAQIEIGYLF